MRNDLKLCNYVKFLILKIKYFTKSSLYEEKKFF